MKVLADNGSMGISSLRRYLDQFTDAVIAHVRPKYMPTMPLAEADLKAINGHVCLSL